MKMNVDSFLLSLYMVDSRFERPSLVSLVQYFKDKNIKISLNEETGIIYVLEYNELNRLISTSMVCRRILKKVELTEQGILFSKVYERKSKKNGSNPKLISEFYDMSYFKFLKNVNNEELLRLYMMFLEERFPYLANEKVVVKDINYLESLYQIEDLSKSFDQKVLSFKK